jgi:hypothetical protein
MGTIGFDIDRPPIYSNPKPFAIFPTPLSQIGRGVGGEGYWQIPIVPPYKAKVRSSLRIDRTFHSNSYWIGFCCLSTELTEPI